MAHLRKIASTQVILMAAITVALAIAPTNALASDGGAIIDKFVEAIGGEAAIAKIKNRVTKSSFSLPDMGMEASLVTYLAPPNAYTKMSSDAFGDTENGVSNGVAWSVSPMQGSSILEGDRKRDALQQASLNPFANWKDNYEKAECVGEEDVSETACWKVVLTPKEGEPQTMFFAKESGLLLKTVRSGEMGMMEIYASDYKEVDGIKIAHKTEIDGGQFRVEITIDSVEQNVPIASDHFVIPDEIKALMPSEEDEASSEGSDTE